MARRRTEMEAGNCAASAKMGMVSGRCGTTNDAGVHGFTATMGGGKNICVDRQVSPNESGLRISESEQRDDVLSGDESIDAAATGIKYAERGAESAANGTKTLNIRFLNSL